MDIKIELFDNVLLICLHPASIPVVGFNAILMSEHFGAFFAFGVLHAATPYLMDQEDASRQSIPDGQGVVADRWGSGTGVYAACGHSLCHHFSNLWVDR